MNRWMVHFGACVFLLWTAIGCSDPYVQRAMEHDRQSMRWALDGFVQREQSSPARLRSTLKIAEQQWDKDKADTRENMVELDRLIQEDRGRWDRHGAEILAEIRRLWDGDPATARWTIPRLLF